jgi:phosphoglycolate phosphatase-like HAD superfamily hydrolase
LRAVFATDFDGTLVDCRRRQLAVVAEALAARGADSSRDFLGRHWRLKREGMNTCDALIHEGMDQGLAKRIADDFKAVVEDERFLVLDRPFPSVERTLDLLRREGYSVHVLTARTRPGSVAAQIERLFGRSVDEVHVVSPRRAADEKAAILRTIEPVCFVGDSESDAQAASAGNVPFFGVSCGQRSATHLRAHGIRVHSRVRDVVLRRVVARLP